MTSSEANDSNTFDFNSIYGEIWQSNQIVLPIPENRFGANTAVRIGVFFTNNARNSFRFNPSETLIPELTTSDGQVLQRLLVTNEPDTRVKTNTLRLPYLGFRLSRLISNFAHLFERSNARNENYVVIESGTSRSLDLDARLFWQNNWLVLEFQHTKFSLTSPSHYYFFDAIQLEAYQLRFIYLNSSRPDSRTRKFRTLPTTASGQLATPFVNLHLVQPIGTNCNAVEVDGIRFETIVPEQLLAVPEKQRGTQTPVQIGMSITNNTPTPLRFDFYATLIPELVALDGQVLQRSYYAPRLESGRKSDFPLAMPGESAIYFPKAKLFWSKRDLLQLEITAGDGGFWVFDALKPGLYQVRFIYTKRNTVETTHEPRSTDTKSLKWIWTSVVPTPFVALSLVSAMN